jgi:hypothetical protein
VATQVTRNRLNVRVKVSPPASCPLNMTTAAHAVVAVLSRPGHVGREAGRMLVILLKMGVGS